MLCAIILPHPPAGSVLQTGDNIKINMSDPGKITLQAERSLTREMACKGNQVLISRGTNAYSHF